MTDKQKTQKLFLEFNKINSDITSLRLGATTRTKQNIMEKLKQKLARVADRLKEAGQDAPGVFYKDVNIINNRIVFTSY